MIYNQVKESAQKTSKLSTALSVFWDPQSRRQSYKWVLKWLQQLSHSLILMRNQQIMASLVTHFSVTCNPVVGLQLPCSVREGEWEKVMRWWWNVGTPWEKFFMSLFKEVAHVSWVMLSIEIPESSESEPEPTSPAFTDPFHIWTQDQIPRFPWKAERIFCSSSRDSFQHRKPSTGLGTASC